MFATRYVPDLQILAAICLILLFVQPVYAESAQDWIDSGYTFNELGRYQDGLLAFDRATSMDPGNKYAWTGKSEALNGLSRNSEALAAAETALAIDSKFKYALLSRANALASLGRSEEALATINNVLTADPGDPFAWSMKSTMLNQMGKPQEALQAAEKALAIDSTKADIWNSKGYALDSLKQFPEALETFNKALDINPNNAYSWSGKSNILNQMGKPDEALQAAEKALSIDTTKADIWNSKGFALLALQRDQEALDMFNKALSIDKNNKWSIKGRDEAQAKLRQAGVTGGSTNTPQTPPTPSVTPPVPLVSDTQDQAFPFVIAASVCIISAASAVILLKKRSAQVPLQRGVEGEKDRAGKTGTEQETVRPAAAPGQVAEHHDVFISYSHEDKPIADAICATLESRRIRCWIAPRDVLPGENFPTAIIQAIEASRIMVLVFSSHSNNSGHVIRELTKAVSKGVIIIPFRIEDVPPSQAMEYLIGVPHWLDAMTPPLEQHMGRLAQTVTVLLEKFR